MTRRNPVDNTRMWSAVLLRLAASGNAKNRADRSGLTVSNHVRLAAGRALPGLLTVIAGRYAARAWGRVQ